MKKILFKYLFFACLGTTIEVCFYALSILIGMTQPIEGEGIYELAGKTYAWMPMIYGCIVFFAPIFKHFMAQYPQIIKSCTAASIIMIVEFISGILLDYLIGTCPWKYNEGIHFMGYVRIDYFPLWVLFAFKTEKLYNYMEENLK